MNNPLFNFLIGGIGSFGMVAFFGDLSLKGYLSVFLGAIGFIAVNVNVRYVNPGVLKNPANDESNDDQR